MAMIAIVAGIVALLAIRECLALARHYGVEPFTMATYIYVGVFSCSCSVSSAIAHLTNSTLRVLDLASPRVVPCRSGTICFLSWGMMRERLGAVYPAAGASAFAWPRVFAGGVPKSAAIRSRLMAGMVRNKRRQHRAAGQPAVQKTSVRVLVPASSTGTPSTERPLPLEAFEDGVNINVPANANRGSPLSASGRAIAYGISGPWR